MRLAVFSDIHGNLNAFNAFLADLDKVGEVDLLWCLGDLAATGGQPRECIQVLRDLKEKYADDKFKIIGGNTDRYLVTGERYPMPRVKEEAGFEAYRSNLVNLGTVYNWTMSQIAWEDYEFLSKILHREVHKRVDGYGDVIGFHAIPGNDEPISLLPDSPDEEAADALLDRAGRLALCGHTHLAMERTVGSWLVVNPGSVGLSNANPGYAEWALLTFEEDEVAVDLRSVPYDVDATLATWESLGYPAMDWITPSLRG